MASTEFAHATMHFTKNLTVESLDNKLATWRSFKEYLEDNDKLYKNLLSFIKLLNEKRAGLSDTMQILEL
jgi:hypothetical protein